jgi:hypothetical protein
MDHPDAAELLYVLQNRYWTINCCKIVIRILRQAAKKKAQIPYGRCKIVIGEV